MTLSATDSASAERRVLLALAVQPIVAALLAFGTFPVFDFTARALFGGRPIDPLDAAVSVSLGAGIAAVLVTVFGAAPVLLLLLRRGPLTRRQVLVSGAVLGNVPAVLIVLLLAMNGVNAATPYSGRAWGVWVAVRAIALGSFIGVASASVFWLLAGRRLAARRWAATANGG